jgi:hypothetical protein
MKMYNFAMYIESEMPMLWQGVGLTLSYSF